MKQLPRILLAILLLSALLLLLMLEPSRYLNLDYLVEQQQDFRDWYAMNQGLAIIGYFLAYIVITALSIPGATVMTLAGGAVMGLGIGVLVISFASTIGATLAFLASRYLFRDLVQQRFANRLETINEGFEREGAYYLFTLRLIPIIPFFLINLLMGLTPMRVRTYFLVSQVGMLPATIVYVNAGTQLGQLESITGLVSPGLLLSFALLGIFPLLVKKLLETISVYRVYRGYKKPRRFDRNLVVIGAGAGGLVSAYIAATVKARVTLIEKKRMGGDCLYTGCVPSKALIRSARFAADAARGRELGFPDVQAKCDFPSVMERIQAVIREVEPHDSRERYQAMGVECLTGEARITSPWTVEVNGQTLSTRNIIIATGAHPTAPPIPGLEDVCHHTSDTIWEIRKLPEHLVVIGGGTIGCELAQSFARLGSKVSIVQRSPLLLSNEEDTIANMITAHFMDEGIACLTGHSPQRLYKDEQGSHLLCESADGEVILDFDCLLIATGRKPNTDGLGVEELGIALNKNGTITTNRYLQTNFPNIYAVGDVAGPYQFTHTAAHQAWYASVNALFGSLRKFKADYSVIPWVTFTDPEIARVGLNEKQAREQDIPYELTSFHLSELDRAIVDGDTGGCINVLTEPGRDRILGVTICGAHAGELIGEFVTAMRHNLGLSKILGTIHAYPTWIEANKYVAGNWKKNHISPSLLNWLERFHTWRRS